MEQYSTSEQIVGKWIDGSTLYCKTYHATGGWTTNLAIDASFVPSSYNMVSLSEIYKLTNSGTVIGRYDGYANNQRYTTFITQTTANGLYLQNNQNISEYTIVVEYTKSS